MSELEIALFILIFGAIGACIASGTGVAFYLSNRVSVIETKFDDWSIMFEKFGKKAIDLMHSPHTPELDALIEKVRMSMASHADWLRMLQLFIEMEKDTTLQKSERALAWFCVIQCKLHLKIPLDPIPHSHTESTT